MAQHQTLKPIATEGLRVFSSIRIEQLMQLLVAVSTLPKLYKSCQQSHFKSEAETWMSASYEGASETAAFRQAVSNNKRGAAARHKPTLTTSCGHSAPVIF